MDRIPAGTRLKALHDLDDILRKDGKRSGTAAPEVGIANSRVAISASGTQWTLIGPQPTNWPNLQYPFPITSGRITALAVDRRDSNVVYLGTANGGVWKTANGGSTWTPLTDTQASLAVGSIALDPTNADIVYVGTGEANYQGSFRGDDYYGAGVLKSTNRGSGSSRDLLRFIQSEALHSNR